MNNNKVLMLLPVHVHIVGRFADGFVTIDGKRLLPDDSQKIRNHSPDGFKWGYAGSGPAQFALALLMLYMPADLAQLHYQNLKFGYIAGLPQKDINVHVNLRWVMSLICKDGPFPAAKRTQHGTS